MREADSSKTTMIEVISFLFFTLFAMILAFFTSAKAFATPGEAACSPSAPASGAMVSTDVEASPASRALPF